MEDNDDIAGVSVLCERRAFDNGTRDFSIYITENDPENPTPLGNFEEYSQETYYKAVKGTKKPYFTKPFEFEGNMLISCDYPILHNWEVKRTVAVGNHVNIEEWLTNENVQRMVEGLQPEKQEEVCSGGKPGRKAGTGKRRDHKGYCPADRRNCSGQ